MYSLPCTILQCQNQGKGGIMLHYPKHLRCLRRREAGFATPWGPSIGPVVWRLRTPTRSIQTCGSHQGLSPMVFHGKNDEQHCHDQNHQGQNLRIQKQHSPRTCCGIAIRLCSRLSIRNETCSWNAPTSGPRALRLSGTISGRPSNPGTFGGHCWVHRAGHRQQLGTSN